MTTPARVAYFFSRYPVVSQTFCDTEMLALERHGMGLEICSVHAPHTSFRHGHAAELNARIYYTPNSAVLKALERIARKKGEWPEEMIQRHEAEYGVESKAALRARNALFFGRTMQRRGIRHLHVHFANRATHTALFIKALTGISFSFTAHARDFMVDIGSRKLLQELCREASFVVAVSDFTRDLLAKMCPESADRIHRVYNGIDVRKFPLAPPPKSTVPRILSVGRLVEFKGFQHLIAACGELKRRGLTFQCEIVGEGPMRATLEQQVVDVGVQDCVTLTGTVTQQEIAQRITTADVFALACDIDSSGGSDVLPTVILESMAAGRPVVSTHVAGVPEMVQHEQTGLLVERANPGALSRALFRLLCDHELRLQYGMAGRARLEETFRVESTSTQLKALFDSTLAAKPPVQELPPIAPFGYLLSEWPSENVPVDTTELVAAAAEIPKPVLYVLHAHASFELEEEELVTSLRFVPDAMVVEAEWRHAPELADRMEGLRDALGGRIPTEHFLRVARRAVYLWRSYQNLGLRHLHAVGADAAICAWIFHRLFRLGYSVTLGGEEKVHASVLKLICEESLGGRLGDPKMLEAFGSRFEAIDCADKSANPVARILDKIGVGTAKKALADESAARAWITRLKEWSSAK